MFLLVYDEQTWKSFSQELCRLLLFFGVKDTYPKAVVQEEMKGNYPPAFRSSDHFGESSFVDLNRKILLSGATQAA